MFSLNIFAFHFMGKISLDRFVHRFSFARCVFTEHDNALARVHFSPFVSSHKMCIVNPVQFWDAVSSMECEKCHIKRLHVLELVFNRILFLNWPKNTSKSFGVVHTISHEYFNINRFRMLWNGMVKRENWFSFWQNYNTIYGKLRYNNLINGQKPSTEKNVSHFRENLYQGEKENEGRRRKLSIWLVIGFRNQISC